MSIPTVLGALLSFAAVILLKYICIYGNTILSLNASDIPLQSMGLSAKRCRLSDLKFYKLSRTSIKSSIRTSDKELFIHLWLSVSMLGNL